MTIPRASPTSTSDLSCPAGSIRSTRSSAAFASNSVSPLAVARARWKWRAARRLAEHTRLGLDSLFFGGSITHSHFAKELDENVWRWLIRRARELIPRHDPIPVGYGYIAEYARSKVDTQNTDAAAEGRGDTVRVVLQGKATVPLKLYAFRDVGDGVEHRLQEVPAYSGKHEARFTAPPGAR